MVSQMIAIGKNKRDINISEMKISSILFMKGYTPPFIKGLSIKRPPLHTVFRISSFILYILKVALFIVVGKNGGVFV
jgi:hypothetical protein